MTQENIRSTFMISNRHLGIALIIIQLACAFLSVLLRYLILGDWHWMRMLAFFEWSYYSSVIFPVFLILSDEKELTKKESENC